MATESFSFVFKSFTHQLNIPRSDEAHLKEVMLWLCRAQDACDGKGVSIKYSVFDGWDQDPYPETTGYILETFLDYAKKTQDTTYYDRAVRAGDWEIEIQHKSGGVLSSVRDLNKLRVFNTGQVIHGWCRLYQESKEQHYLDAAVRASNYLLAQQEDDGSWIKDTYDFGPRTYQTRTSWALLRVFQLTGNVIYADAAYRNLDWSLTQQQANGWFRNCGLADADPITHVIAYTLRGLLEAHLMIVSGTAPKHDSNYLQSVIIACDAFCESVDKNPALGIKGLPYCSYNSKWESLDRDSCLTGNVQMAGILFKLSKITKNARYQKTANTILDTTKRTQDLSSSVDGIRGGLAGSFPFHRGYANDCYLNWATKFMADALLMRIQDQGNTE